MGEFTHVIATTTEEFPRLFEVLRDQEFRISEVRHDPKKGFVDILFLRKFPPHKGLWFLRIPWVRAWRVDVDSIHDRETLKDIRWDPKALRLVLVGILHEFTADVERLDLRLGRLDEDDPAKVKFDKLPEWLKAEVRAQDAEHEAEVERVRVLRRSTRISAAVVGTICALVVGAASLGDPAILAVSCPLLAGGGGWFLLGSRMSPQFAGTTWGVLATVAAALSGPTNFVSMLFGSLLLVAGGVYIGIWLRGSEDMHR